MTLALVWSQGWLGDELESEEEDRDKVEVFESHFSSKKKIKTQSQKSLCTPKFWKIDLLSFADASIHIVQPKSIIFDDWSSVKEHRFSNCSGRDLSLALGHLSMRASSGSGWSSGRPCLGWWVNLCSFRYRMCMIIRISRPQPCLALLPFFSFQNHFLSSLPKTEH